MGFETRDRLRVWVGLCRPSAYPYPQGGLSNPRDTRSAGLEYFESKNPSPPLEHQPPTTTSQQPTTTSRPPPPPTSHDGSLVVSQPPSALHHHQRVTMTRWWFPQLPCALHHHLSTATSRPPTTTTNHQPHLCCLYRPPTSHRDSLVGLLPWIWVVLGSPVQSGFSSIFKKTET